jgi:hypothetical protein
MSIDTGLNDTLEVRITLSDMGAADIADMLRSVAAEIESEPLWQTTSSPIHLHGTPVGHWRVIDGDPIK